nr:unnamed protein product [Digitaria exilis]
MGGGGSSLHHRCWPLFFSFPFLRLFVLAGYGFF